MMWSNRSQNVVLDRRFHTGITNSFRTTFHLPLKSEYFQQARVVCRRQDPEIVDKSRTCFPLTSAVGMWNQGNYNQVGPRSLADQKSPH